MDEGGRESAVLADDQLAAIGELSQALDDAGLEYWLFGGWAVDFWVGEVTRVHDDIDVAAWRSDFDAVKSALTAGGWEHTPTAADLVGTRYRRGRAQVEFTFVEEGEAGEVVVPLATGAVTWSATPFGDERLQLRGVSCRTIPLAILSEGKAARRQGVAEGAKDLADFEALSRLVERD
jgi:Aminoglycoside-2''-adenylyltransferase